MVKFKSLSETWDFGMFASAAKSLATFQYFKALTLTATRMGINLAFGIVYWKGQHFKDLPVDLTKNYQFWYYKIQIAKRLMGFDVIVLDPHCS